MLVEFASPWHKGKFSASADRLRMANRGVITIEPGDNVLSKIGAKDARGGSPGFNTARLQFPKLRVQNVGDGVQLIATPSNRAGGKRRGWANPGALRLDLIPSAAMRRKSQTKNTMGAGAGVWLSIVMQINERSPSE